MWLFVATLAFAQEATVPAASVAGSDPAWAPMVSPALTAYDRDPRLGLVVFDDGAGALAVGRGGLGLGGSWSRDDVDGKVDASVDLNGAVRLPDGLAIGSTLRTHLPAGETAFAALGLGTAWRPLPTFGIGGALHDVAAHRAGTYRRAAAGLVLRDPAGRVSVAADWVVGLDDGRQFVQPALHLRPFRGLRLFSDMRLNVDQVAVDSVSVGATVGLVNLGVGGAVTSAGQALSGAFLLHDDDPERALLRPKVTTDLHLDRTPPYEPRRGLFGRDDTPTWSETLATVQRAASDPTRKRLVVRLDGAALSWARAQELRTAIRSVVEAGKPVTAWLGPNVGTGSYWVATAATEVAMDPSGQLDLTGGAVDLVHLRGLLDRVGIEAQMVRRSEYKSAAEPMTLNEPTAEALEQIEVLLDDVYDGIVTDIGKSRGKAEEVVASWIDDGPWDADAALEAGLVDKLLYPDELHAGDGPDVVGALLANRSDTGWATGRSIALIHVEGAIVDGQSSSGGMFGSRTSGADTIVRQLETALRTSRIRAVVLRVDSPGGSATASDAIWRAVERVKDKKPVVVSMGGVAASGGYYVACGADAIWAEPHTITGSIGVFTTKISAGDLFDRVGVTSTVVQRGRNADLDSTSHAWNVAQREKMQGLVDAIYARFKSRVAEGRSLDALAVEEVARGRVWSGARAKEAGLVDELGGLGDAIADAAARAGLSSRRDPPIVSVRDDGELLDLLAPGARLQSPTIEVLLAPLQPLLLVAGHPEVSAWALDPTWMMEPSR